VNSPGLDAPSPRRRHFAGQPAAPGLLLRRITELGVDVTGTALPVHTAALRWGV